jgi:hypothetical protein
MKAIFLTILSLSLHPLPSLTYQSIHKIQKDPTATALHSFSSSLEPERPRLLLEPIAPIPLLSLQTSPVASIPTRPKVVVFGPSTPIGRRIIRTLMESKIDLDVVAFVSDYKEWMTSTHEELVMASIVSRKGRGTTLTVVEGDLMEFTFTSFEERNYDDENVTQIAKTAEYNSEQLHRAIAGSTAVISCLRPLRPTNFYTDYLRVPFVRIWNYNVSSWCTDKNHPYYVYLANERIVQEAELEQQRREEAMELERERCRLEDQWDQIRSSRTKDKDLSIATELRRKRQRLGKSIDTYSNSLLFDDFKSRNESIPLKSASVLDRIKFIRISDVNLGRNPWRIGNVLTNVFCSLEMRYEDRLCERLLRKSQLLDTVVLRVGEVVGEERVR